MSKRRHRGCRSCRAGRWEKARRLIKEYKTPGVFDPSIFPVGPTPAPPGYKSPPQTITQLPTPPAVPPPRPPAQALPRITRIENITQRVQIVRPPPVLPIPQAPKTGTSVGTIVQRSSRQTNAKWDWFIKAPPEIQRKIKAKINVQD
ncbi:hypothetical protein PUN28_013917 [Cardiocondyla obscurior]|uniref:Uncharacterized protein n=1 Tax=Cardiocondyla obscurior TaxID=286306 RepID=A0AAW2F9N0_9HYME